MPSSFAASARQSARSSRQYSGVPVYNGLTDEVHPTQTLADFMTMREFTHKPLSDMAVLFMGDVRNNVARSLALGAMKLGMDMRLCGPRGKLWPGSGLRRARFSTLQSGADHAARVRRRRRALPGCDFVYTDVWLSMGEPKEKWAERIRAARALPRDRGRHAQRPASRTPSSCTACRPSTTPRPRAEEISQQFGIDCMEVDRGGLRIAALDRLRSGREPDAHDQGHPRRDARLGRFERFRAGRRKSGGDVTGPTAFENFTFLGLLGLIAIGLSVNVMMSDGLSYLSLNYYASPEWSKRFVFVGDADLAAKYLGTDSVDKNVLDLRPYLPIHASEFSEFMSTHSEFLLYSEDPGYGFGWLPYHLSRGPWSLRVYLKAPNRTLYLVTRTEGALR